MPRRLTVAARGYRPRQPGVAPWTAPGAQDAHAAAAFFASPFESAAVLTIDRGGDYLSTTFRLGAGSRLTTIGQIRDPQSIGEVYSAVTWYLGFATNAGEGKVMGLAPYGSDRFVDELRQVVRLEPEGRAPRPRVPSDLLRGPCHGTGGARFARPGGGHSRARSHRRPQPLGQRRFP